MLIQIRGEDLERSERLIKVLFEKGDWPESALKHFNIDLEAMSLFIRHEVATLRQIYADIDPRHEAAIATLMLHLFLCGVAAGRHEGYSTDSGLNT